MITLANFKTALEKMGFSQNNELYEKNYFETDAYLKVDFKAKKLIYPIDKGFSIKGDFTTSFSQNENFVVFECVNRLFEKGYKPNHIVLEPKWTVGHGASGGRADILIKDNTDKALLIIECKTAGKEFNDEWKKTKINGGQIFSYAKQAGSTQFICLYTSDLIDSELQYSNYIITLIDNESLLSEIKDKKPLSYAEAKLLDKEDIFKSWSETYSQDYATRGIFESDINAYEIGKTKYTLADLNVINSKDIQGKYHEFATILRQHNVSGRENAFDKLVNLFLCKIVDETNNPNQLKFHWKGIAYDSFFDLQDRLQKLYQEGMKKFLGEEVTYVDNEEIENAFRYFRNDPDATKETIKKYFRELKFFTNNDFAFIDVHNERLFYQNAAILLKVVQMLQDIKLKTNNQNQFLGDMFEGFLDQGVKQSEGQFFTPMPIVKFILNSLPLEDIINNSQTPPKVIDYASGSGHFLNEYAKQINNIIKENHDSNEYLKNIYGIEKEYRLSKVAKVSAFMYGQDEINIIYNDALSEHENIKNGDFSLLIANPPYSVKGFLETLPEKDRQKYELTETIGKKSYSVNNSIETFFIERAKQLLKSDGIAAIIIPSSILGKGKYSSTSKSRNVYVACREILLKNFEIVAISEFGSGTFGKTGTNTVALFLRKRKSNPDPAEHFLNRVNDWFEFKMDKDIVFEDRDIILKYCKHSNFELDDYLTLLQSNPNEKLLNHPRFIAYRKEFNKWSEIKNRKKQTSFKKLSKAEQEEELNEEFIEFSKLNEKERLYYFILTGINSQDVLIIKSPSKTADIKKFLGYEWSSAKGKEGIKYFGSTDVFSENEIENDWNEEFEEEDKRVLNNIFNIESIQTPLYNPNNINDPKKINYLIKQNFRNEVIEIPEDLQNYVTTIPLTNLLDFETMDFNKQINLNPKWEMKIETKWDIVKIADIMQTSSGGTPQSDVNAYYDGGTIPWINSGEVKSGIINKANNFITKMGLDNSSAKLFPTNTVLVAMYGATAGQVGILKIEAATNQAVCGILPSENYNSMYLYYYLNTQLENFLSMRMGVARLNLSQGLIKEFKIPLPPKEVQQQIVEECTVIDNSITEKQIRLKQLTQEFNQLIAEIYSSKFNMSIFEEFCLNIQYGLNEKMNEFNKGFKIFRMNEIINGSMNDNGNMKYVDLTDDEIKGYILQKGDILFNRTNSFEQVGKAGIFDLNGTYTFASYLVRIQVDTEKANPEFVNYVMQSEQFQTYVKKYATKAVNQSNISAGKLKVIAIPLPNDIYVQNMYVEKFNKIDEENKNLNNLIIELQLKKEETLKKYL